MRERSRGRAEGEKKIKRGEERGKERQIQRGGGAGLWAGPGVSRQMGECETGGTDARL